MSPIPLCSPPQWGGAGAYPELSREWGVRLQFFLRTP